MDGSDERALLPGWAHAARVARHAELAARLNRMPDSELLARVASSPTLGTGIGGVRHVVSIGGTTVFVKRVPLTDLERQAANLRSTRNLFDLPVGCQYGVGSPSFGVWREVAANEMATEWVLGGRLACFPLLYHWRVLDGPASDRPLSDELADLDAYVAYWHGSEAVRHRAEQLAASTSTVALFLEHVPSTLPGWLREQAAIGPVRLDAAVGRVEQRLRHDVVAMNELGLFHFDAHLDNIVTNGDELFFADLGLAVSRSFDLSPGERAFLDRHLSHDVAHTITRLVDWLVTELAGAIDADARDEVLRACAQGASPPSTLPSAARTMVARDAPLAVVVNQFYARLHLEDRRASYPAEEVESACATVGLALPRRV